MIEPLLTAKDHADAINNSPMSESFFFQYPLFCREKFQDSVAYAYDAIDRAVDAFPTFGKAQLKGLQPRCEVQYWYKNELGSLCFVVLF